MDPILTDVNWTATLVGAIAAFGLGMVWFGPLFGRVWAAGSHGIVRPSRPPVGAMVLQALGTLLVAWLVGAMAGIDALLTTIVAILGCAALQTAGALFSQKTAAAAVVDGGYVVAMGAVMILFQGLI